MNVLSVIPNVCVRVNEEDDAITLILTRNKLKPGEESLKKILFISKR